MKKVLIVEDEKPVARAMQLKLQFSGFDVKNAFDGEEALDILKDESFDIILLDLILPKKDGFAVLAELKERNNKTPIIIISNLGQDEDIKKVKELCGECDYFIKSNTPISEIVEYVKKNLGITTN